MARGGYRPGAGRKLGCRDRINVELERAVESAPGNTLEEKMLSIFDDTAQPTRLRLEALRRESTLLALRVLNGKQ